MDVSKFVRLSFNEAVNNLSYILGIDSNRAICSIEELLNRSFLYDYMMGTNKDIYSYIVGYKCIKGDKEYCLPFILSKDYYTDSYCLIAPYPIHYYAHSVYKSLIGDEYKPLNTDDTLVAKFPLVFKPKEEDFRTYLKNHRRDYIPRFFGEKANRIKWELISTKDTRYNRTIEDTSSYYIEHNKKFFVNSSKKDISLINLYVSWKRPILEDEYMMCAYDIETNKYVFSKYIFIIGNVAQCHTIAPNPSDEYKPYALLVSSDYAVIRDIFYSEKFKSIDTIDFGNNFEDVGNHKKAFLDKVEPLCNFDILSIEESNYLFSLGENNV